MSKEQYAVMRYPNADAFCDAQQGMGSYQMATEIARQRAETDPDGVCVIVRIVAVVPGRWAPVNMDTQGAVQ